MARSIALGCVAEEAFETGAVSFSTWGEDLIENEIPSSMFADGWTIKYTKFLVVLGDVRIADLNDLGAFVTALSRTVGHFRGEGECISTNLPK